MLVYIQSAIAIVLGIVASSTDFKEKKIFNKHILVAVGISLITYIIFWKQIHIELIKSYFINLFVSILISFLFFYFKIWAAGDAKLFLAIILMIPYELYEVDNRNVFPGIYVLILMFSLAFFYVVIETIYLWIRDSKKLEKIRISNIKKEDIKNFIIQYLMGYFLILFINNITLKFFNEFKMNNGGLLLLCNMLILLFIYRIIKSEKQMLIGNLLLLIFNILYYCIFGFEIYTANFKILFLVMVILIFRCISEKYNYEEINVEDLKARMILSYGSVLRMYSSNVKGLPKSTTETTDSRLSKEEVESIKRWSKTRRGQKTITIVRHMPFAPFICLGEIVFFIIKLYC